MKLITVLIFSCFSFLVVSQQRTQTVGFELDLLPYISGGWYASIWYGEQNFRLRAVYAETNIPKFVVPDGFKDHHLKAAAGIIDYFIKPNFEGWWVAIGYEYWQNQISNDSATDTREFYNHVATFGGGYVWKFWQNFYLNPWAAGHILLTGSEEFYVGNDLYKPSVFTPELSLKVGWHF